MVLSVKNSMLFGILTMALAVCEPLETSSQAIAQSSTELYQTYSGQRLNHRAVAIIYIDKSKMISAPIMRGTLTYGFSVGFYQPYIVNISGEKVDNGNNLVNIRNKIIEVPAGVYTINVGCDNANHSQSSEGVMKMQLAGGKKYKLIITSAKTDLTKGGTLACDLKMTTI